MEVIWKKKRSALIYKSIGVIIVKKTLAIYLDLLRSIQKKRDQLQRLNVLNVVIHSLSYSVEVFNMQYRGLEFEEQEFNDCLNILHKEVVSFLNKNNIAMDFFQYPVKDICRIIFREKINMRTAAYFNTGQRLRDTNSPFCRLPVAISAPGFVVELTTTISRCLFVSFTWFN